MTTRAEEIAAELYYTQPWEKEEDRQLFSELNAIAEREQAAFVNGHKQGQQDRWVSVSERLPEDGTDVFVFTKYKYRGVGCITEGYWYLTISPETDQEDGVVTHWMPLPPSPPNPEQR